MPNFQTFFSFFKSIKSSFSVDIFKLSIMKKQNSLKKHKRIALYTLIIFSLMLFILSIHIYIVTRPHITASTRIMARIDFNQAVRPVDAVQITNWLYHQKGVEHVLCNGKSGMAVFTYSPLVTNANSIIASLNRETDYHAVRYMPSAQELSTGCPAAVHSVSYKLYSLIHHIF